MLHLQYNKHCILAFNFGHTEKYGTILWNDFSLVLLENLLILY